MENEGDIAKATMVCSELSKRIVVTRIKKEQTCLMSKARQPLIKSTTLF
jgi:hypothetical protein